MFIRVSHRLCKLFMSSHPVKELTFTGKTNSVQFYAFDGIRLEKVFAPHFDALNGQMK